MILLMLLLVLAAAGVVATVHAVLTDGYGQLPTPRSHPGWDEADRLR